MGAGDIHGYDGYDNIQAFQKAEIMSRRPSDQGAGARTGGHEPISVRAMTSPRRVASRTSPAANHRPAPWSTSAEYA